MAFVYQGEQVDLGFGRGWLNRPAAQSIRRIDQQIGHALQISEAGRSWDQQNRFFQLYLSGRGAIALNPDTPSVHQYGGAIDSNEAQEIISILEDHGWRRTVYRWVNGVWTLVERWHFEHFESLDNHRNDPAPEEEDMTPDQSKKLDKVSDFIDAIGGKDFAEKLTAVRMFDGVPGVDLSTPRLRLALDGAIDTRDRIVVDANGDGAKDFDIAQLVRNEIQPALAGIADAIDLDALADKVAERLGRGGSPS